MTGARRRSAAWALLAALLAVVIAAPAPARAASTSSSTTSSSSSTTSSRTTSDTLLSNGFIDVWVVQDVSESGPYTVDGISGYYPTRTTVTILMHKDLYNHLKERRKITGTEPTFFSGTYVELNQKYAKEVGIKSPKLDDFTETKEVPGYYICELTSFSFYDLETESEVKPTSSNGRMPKGRYTITVSCDGYDNPTVEATNKTTAFAVVYVGPITENASSSSSTSSSSSGTSSGSGTGTDSSGSGSGTGDYSSGDYSSGNYDTGSTSTSTGSTDTSSSDYTVTEAIDPTITVSGVVDKGAYNNVVAPTISIVGNGSKINSMSWSLYGQSGGTYDKDNTVEEVTEDGDYYITIPDFEHIAQNDDIYTLTIYATTESGGSADLTLTFSVNRFGSTYQLLDKEGKSLSGKYLKAAEDVVVHEINVSGVEVGNTQVLLVHNDEVTELTEGVDYTRELVESENSLRTVIEYNFPQGLFEGESGESKSGYFRLRFTSFDEAGNTTQSTMDATNEDRTATAALNFAIDSVSPYLDVTGVFDDEVYFGETTLTINTHDNLELAKMGVRIDGEDYRVFGKDETDEDTWSYDSTSVEAEELSGETYEVALPADGNPHTIEVYAKDKAGNETTKTVNNVTVAGNVFQYAWRNPLRAGLITLAALLGAAVLGGAVVFTMGWRPGQLTKFNPFDHEE